MKRIPILDLRDVTCCESSDDGCRGGVVRYGLRVIVLGKWAY